MNKDQTFPVTADQFSDWLDKQPDRSIVGARNKPAACPCQRCFVEITGKHAVIVETNYTEFGGERWQNPGWLRALVRRIDYSGGYSTRITAGRVRRLLAKVCKELGV